MRMEILEQFRKEGKLSPNFRDRVTYISNQLPPVRAYIHESCSFEAFSSPCNRSIDIEAKEHLILSLGKNLELVEDADYMLAAIWGNENSKMIDVFKYTDVKDWPGNPDVSAFVMQNGVYIPRKEITCGDTLIVLGIEEKYRRTTKSLKEYMKNPPGIEGLIPY